MVQQLSYSKFIFTALWLSFENKGKSASEIPDSEILVTVSYTKLDKIWRQILKS